MGVCADVRVRMGGCEDGRGVVGGCADVRVWWVYVQMGGYVWSVRVYVQV